MYTSFGGVLMCEKSCMGKGRLLTCLCVSCSKRWSVGFLVSYVYPIRLQCWVGEVLAPWEQMTSKLCMVVQLVSFACKSLRENMESELCP